jgi:hypothetical protein
MAIASGTAQPSSGAPEIDPRLVSAALPGYGATSWWAKSEPLVVALLLVTFALPVVIGYRRSQRSRRLR